MPAEDTSPLSGEFYGSTYGAEFLVRTCRHFIQDIDFVSDGLLSGYRTVVVLYGYHKEVSANVRSGRRPREAGCSRIDAGRRPGASGKDRIKVGGNHEGVKGISISAYDVEGDQVAGTNPHLKGVDDVTATTRIPIGRQFGYNLIVGAVNYHYLYIADRLTHQHPIPVFGDTDYCYGILNLIWHQIDLSIGLVELEACQGRQRVSNGVGIYEWYRRPSKGHGVDEFIVERIAIRLNHPVVVAVGLVAADIGGRQLCEVRRVVAKTIHVVDQH